MTRPDPTQGGKSRDIPFRYFHSLAGDRAPLVLVYPSLVNQMPVIEELVGRQLAYSGYHAIVVDLVEDIAELDRRPEQIDDFFRRSNWSSAELLSEAQGWGEILPEEVHALGVSLGGIRASIAYGEDSRLKKLILYVTGGNLPEIMARSEVKLVQNYKAHWKEKLGLATDTEFSEHLQGVLTIDPLEAAKIRSGKNVFMVMGNADEKVPYASQLALYEAFGRPESRFMPFGHRMTGMRSIYRFDEILHFLRKSLR